MIQPAYNNYLAYPGIFKMRDAKPEELIELVCSHFEVTPEQIRSKVRHSGIVIARQMAAYLLQYYTTLTTTKCGRMINRDHATVLHCVKVINNIKEIKDLKDVLEKITTVENICNRKFIRYDRYN